MTSMLERIIPRINTKDCWKILIECAEKPSRNDCINLLGVYSVQVFFDINMFWEMNSFEKKKYVVKKIREAIGIIAQHDFFAVEEIQKACDEIVDSNYVNEWYWNKPVKLKQMSVQVKVLHEVESVNIYMVFKDSVKNVYIEKLLVSEIPDERVLHLALSGKHLGVCDDGNNGCQRTDNGRSLRTEIIAADKLHYHGNHSHPEGDDEIFDKIMLIGKRQDDKRQEDKER